MNEHVFSVQAACSIFRLVLERYVLILRCDSVFWLKVSNTVSDSLDRMHCRVLLKYPFSLLSRVAQMLCDNKIDVDTVKFELMQICMFLFAFFIVIQNVCIEPTSLPVTGQ